jgi:hypothetical protein
MDACMFFFKQITFRRDPTNHRPRINKAGSSKDKAQKAAGKYFFLDDVEDDKDDLFDANGKRLSKADIRKNDRDKKNAASTEGVQSKIPNENLTKKSQANKAVAKDKKDNKEMALKKADLEDLIALEIAKGNVMFRNGVVDENAPAASSASSASFASSASSASSFTSASSHATVLSIAGNNNSKYVGDITSTATSASTSLSITAAMAKSKITDDDGDGDGDDDND